MMLADASMAYGASAQLRPGLQVAERAMQLLGARGSQEVRAHVLANYGSFLLFRGHGRRARPVLDEADRLAEGIDPLSPAGQSITLTLNLHLWSGDFERVRDRCLAACARARETGTLSALPLLLLLAADASYRLGEWDATDTYVAECLATSDDCGQPAYVDHARAVGAVLAAARGDEQEARRATAAVFAGAEATGVHGNVGFALAALGFLEFSLGRVDAAIGRLEGLARFLEETGMEEPTLMPWAPDLIEAYLRAGRTDDARRTLGVLGRQAVAAHRGGAVRARSRHRRGRVRRALPAGAALGRRTTAALRTCPHAPGVRTAAAPRRSARRGAPAAACCRGGVRTPRRGAMAAAGRGGAARRRRAAAVGDDVARAAHTAGAPGGGGRARPEQPAGRR